MPNERNPSLNPVYDTVAPVSSISLRDRVALDLFSKYVEKQGWVTNDGIGIPVMQMARASAETAYKLADEFIQARQK